MLTVRKHQQLLKRIATASIAVVPFSVGTALLISPHTAHAEAVTYSTSKRTYKVGILLLDSTIDADNDGVISGAEAAKGPENPDPFVFYIADQRTDIKPAGWELDNPLAPATVTTDIYTRWSGPGARDPGHPYQVGQKVTKDMAAYWEVSLTKATESELLQFDVLFITNHRLTKLLPQDREKLRKVVDAGGIVWLDDCGGMRLDPDGRFFLNDLQFQGNVSGLTNTNGPVLYQPAHPLLNSPYALSYNDILALGDKGYGNYFMSTFKPNPTGVNDVDQTAPNKETLTTVIGNRAATDSVTGLAMPYISSGIYGSGAVILTSADIGCGVNDYVGGFAGNGGNSGAYSGKNLLAANSEDLKFLYNTVAFGGANNTVRRNNRRTASSSSAVSAPLNPAFDFAATQPNRVISTTAPLISQGILYVSGIDAGGNATVRAYDTVPNRDYDNDGNFDDGVPDLISGTPYDEIWRWTGGAAGAPSAPVLANVTTGGLSANRILVTLRDGTVVSLDALPVNPSTKRLLPVSTVQGTNGPIATGGTFVTTETPAPVFEGNKVFAVEPTGGVVRCIDASNFSTQWSSAATPGPYQPTATPTLGLNRLVVNKTRDTNRTSTENTIAGNTNESTNDVMLYVPVRDPSGGSTVSAKVLPYWLGTRGEGTKDVNFDGTNYVMRLRPAAANADQVFISKGGNGFIQPIVRLYADVTMPDPISGNTVTYTREENFAAGRAVYPKPDPFFGGAAGTWTVTWQNSTVNSSYYSGRVTIAVAGGTASPSRVLAIADYDVVYAPFGGGGNPANLTQGHRNAGPLTIPSGGPISTISFAPNDLLLYSSNQPVTITGATSPSYGALFGMQEREFSLSASRLRWRYLLHDGYTGQINGQPITDLPALRNRIRFATQDLTPNAPFYEPLTNANIVGSPITTNDGITYALASANSVLNGPVTVLMAFQSTPQITLDLGEPVEATSAVTVSQYDPLTGNTITTAGDPNDRTRVDVDFRSGKVTIADFGALNNGANLFSASSSFVVTYSAASGQAGTNAAGSQKTVVISPFGAVQNITPGTINDITLGATASTSGGFSPLLWYYVLPGTPSADSSPVKIGDQIFLNISNQIVAVDADPAGNDPSVRLRSGEQVYAVLDSLGGKPVDRNHVRWAATVPAGAGALSGNEGVLAINSPLGTTEFSEGITLIADNTRVMEVNADGAAIWSTDGTVDQKTSGGAAPIYGANGTLQTPADTRGRQTYKTRGFSSPQTVRRLGATDYLVADTGNNRVVRFDRAGILQWSAERISDPYGILAPGDPLTLNSPTDVLTRRLSSFDAGGARIGFESHYIITDSGNGRIIDVVDYFDLNGRPRAPIAGGPSTGIVVWTTRTKSSGGQNLSYHNLQLIAGRDSTGLAGKPILVASVSNSSVAALNNNDAANGPGGALVQLDYNPYNTAFILVDTASGTTQIKYYWAQQPGSTLPYNPAGPPAIPEPATDGKVLLAINELRVKQNDAVTNTKPLNAASYFEQIPLDLDGDGQPESVYLVVDGDGVYACLISVDTATGKSYFDVIWSFQQAQYTVMNQTRFADAAGRIVTDPGFLLTNDIAPRLAAGTVKRLANGNFLIVNSATGSSSIFESGQFSGEVFEVTPTTLPSGKFDLTGSGATLRVNNSLAGGTFAGFSAPRVVRGSLNAGLRRDLNKQQMGRDANGATLTEQPRSADRQ